MLKREDKTAHASCFHNRLQYLHDNDDINIQGKFLMEFTNINDVVKNRNDILKMFIVKDLDKNNFICKFCDMVIDMSIYDTSEDEAF